MRERYQKQLPLIPSPVEHPHARELEVISQILDENSSIVERVYQDLNHKARRTFLGAKGTNAEQVLQAAIIKQLNEFSYEELAFHIIDSSCYRWFCRIGLFCKGFKSSALCSNIKSLSAETWEKINAVLVNKAKHQKIEKGRQVRMECTVVGSNIHDTKDSILLWDGVRVLTRLLSQAKERIENSPIRFTDHTRVAKRRMLAIANAKTQKHRTRLYQDLLKVAEKTVYYAYDALELIPLSFKEQLKHYIILTEKIIDQTHRRVILGEKVPASEKIVSIFEDHTGILVKKRRDTLYGHKICLTGGASNLILDCVILDGNPADSDLTMQMIDRQKDIYGRYLLKVALDGGFASKDNLKEAKCKHISDVCFSKGRGLEIEDMCRSPWVYKRLRKFPARIEFSISWVKRCFGLCRCTWKRPRSFKSYVWASIVTANLLTLARAKLKLQNA